MFISSTYSLWWVDLLTIIHFSQYSGMICYAYYPLLLAARFLDLVEYPQHLPLPIIWGSYSSTNLAYFHSPSFSRQNRTSNYNGCTSPSYLHRCHYCFIRQCIPFQLLCCCKFLLQHGNNLLRCLQLVLTTGASTGVVLLLVLSWKYNFLTFYSSIWHNLILEYNINTVFYSNTSVYMVVVKPF